MPRERRPSNKDGDNENIDDDGDDASDDDDDNDRSSIRTHPREKELKEKVTFSH